MLARADVVLINGEEPSPQLSERVVIVVIDEESFVSLGLPARAHELVAQTVTGAVFEHIPGRPAINGMMFGTYGAAINAATAVVAALIDRLSSGLGQRVHVSMSGGVVAFMGVVWSEFTADDRTHGFAPVGADFPLFRCADGQYLCITTGPARLTAASAASEAPQSGLELLKEALELDVDVAELRGTRRADDLQRYYVNYDVIAEGFARFGSAEILERLRDADFSIELVRPPGGAWSTAEVADFGPISTCPCGAQHVGIPIEGL